MRIKLADGKQRELVEKAKENLSWSALSKMLGISGDYLRLDLRKEKILLSKELYKKLCNLAKENFDIYIIEELADNWGRAKGGRNSRGSTIKLNVSRDKKALSEFIGIILGDGNVNFYKKGKKIGVYQIRIAGDCNKDRLYHINYIKPLCESLFNLNAKIIENKNHNERFLFLSSKELVEFFIKMGIKSGNKITNQSTIPEWVFEKKSYIQACIRGLIDTDGSVFRMSKRDSNLIRINLKNYDFKLLNDARNAFIKLDFHPSKITCGNSFCISRQKEIERYLREIGFSNQKHLDRLQKFKDSPVV